MFYYVNYLLSYLFTKVTREIVFQKIRFIRNSSFSEPNEFKNDNNNICYYYYYVPLSMK